MRLVTFETNGIARVGVMVNDKKILDLNFAYMSMLREEGELAAKEIADAMLPSDMKGFLRRGDKGLEFAKSIITKVSEDTKGSDGGKIFYDLNDVKLCAPISNPDKIICLSHNYTDFIERTGVPVPPVPRIFSKFSNSICGPQDPIIKPNATNELGYEAELAFIIGKPARNVKAEDAYDYVAGYTILNDVSASDLTNIDKQVLRGKTFDTFAPIGPAIVTKDEVEDPHNLDIKCWVNDKIVQDENTKHVLYQTPELVEFLSGIFTLEPGDIVATGTPYGIAKYLPNPVYMKAGDTCTIEIEKLGILSNLIVDEK